MTAPRYLYKIKEIYVGSDKKHHVYIFNELFLTQRAARNHAKADCYIGSKCEILQYSVTNKLKVKV